ncbi:MAG: aminoglycoside phosphotransferase family protein [Clostridia bacterium]|nr:aminoglycoside phosphotransferase family protein [Clostridia bacterium]
MDFQDIAAQFGITAPIVAEEEIHSGNINRTYLVTVQDEDEARQYIFQRINTFVFKNPEAVMSNIIKVTEHIKQKLTEKHGTYDRRVLSFLKTTDGKPYYYSGTHHFFRVYEYVANAVAHDVVDSADMFYEAGREFGEFQGCLSDFPAQTLAEIIPDFHNTPARYAAFHQAVDADKAGRRAEVEEEIRFLLDRQDGCEAITNALCSGEIPVRVTHNDTKINNILFDKDTDEAICVIDLDTVMPGSSLYDFGDAVRYGASTAREDERDLSKVSFDLALYEQFAKGFVKGADGLLHDEEIALMPHSALIMTLELATRFLADYLNGDEYFKINAPDHNLVRARCQIRLAQDIEAKWEDLCEITRRCRH